MELNKAQTAMRLPLSFTQFQSSVPLLQTDRVLCSMRYCGAGTHHAALLGTAQRRMTCSQALTSLSVSNKL